MLSSNIGSVNKKNSRLIPVRNQTGVSYAPENRQLTVDKWFSSLSLLSQGVNLFLIPEDIARYIDYSSVSKDECFKLTHDEYESGNIDRVVKYIEENWNIIS